VLGFLDEGSFLGGGMQLDRDAAARAIEEHVARPLGLSLEHAAAGIYEIVNVTMATGVRDVSVRRGLDPRDLPLVVAGGAGPVHAAAIAAELEIPLLVVPRESSIFCAAGMLMSDFKHDFVRAYKTELARVDGARLLGLFAEMEREGREVLAREQLEDAQISIRRALDLRYVGQWHELTVPTDATDLESIRSAFDAQHDRLFGYASPEAPVELLAVRATALGTTTKLPPHQLDGGGSRDAARALIGTRSAWSPGTRSMQDTPVYDGLMLAAGASLRGPAIVELANTTIVVLDGFRLTVDPYGAFVLAAGDESTLPALRIARASRA
jgi:N-methylhydantoinase A